MTMTKVNTTRKYTTRYNSL